MDARENAYVLWFDELHRKDVNLVGGKSSSLGELTTSTGVPVPYGYATTAHAYRYFMEATGQNKKIHELLQGLDDVEDSVELHEVCTKIRESIVSAEMPEDLAQQIGDAYEELAKKWARKILMWLSVLPLPPKICRMLPLPASRILTSILPAVIWSSEK